MDTDVSKLIEKKLQILTRILELTKATVFGNDNDINIRKYTTLYSRRATMIDEVKAIDYKIKNEYKEDPNTHEINVVIQKIIAEDDRISKYEDGFITFLEDREKENKK